MSHLKLMKATVDRLAPTRCLANIDGINFSDLLQMDPYWSR